MGWFQSPPANVIPQGYPAIPVLLMDFLCDQHCAEPISMSNPPAPLLSSFYLVLHPTPQPSPLLDGTKILPYVSDD